jgi:hypothetical protein
MFAAKTTAITVLVALNLALGVAFLSTAPAFAQGGSIQGSAQSQISYRTSYPQINADSNSSVRVQSEHHLYKPGDTVKITGSVSGEMRDKAKSDTVTVKLADAKGSVVTNQQAKVDSKGEYSTSLKLPASAQVGEYSAGSKLEVEASVLGLLDAQVMAKLESSTTFVVASSSSTSVKSDGGEEFKVDIASNSTVSNVQFKQSEKMVTFKAEGETGTIGVTQVTVPKAMLSGEMVVMIDGKAVASDSNDVIVTSDTSAETTYEINYHHSEHDVSVTGTNVVPEFPLATLVMAGAVGSIVAVLAIARKKGLVSWPKN